MQSTKPYLLRALYEWCVDQGYTPHLAVAVDATTRVPREFVRDGQIVLNVSPEATHQLQIGNDEISFQARFSGKPFPVVVPVARIAAIYARENGEGMAFEVTELTASDAGTVTHDADATPAAGEAPGSDEPPPRPAGRSHLTRVK